MKTGTYEGDGNATQAVTGIGFQPKYVRIYPQNGNPYAFKCDQDGTYAMVAQHYEWREDMIISFESDGFTVGDGTGYANILNLNGVIYSYVAWAY